MCKELLVIPVNKVVDPKRIIRKKMEGRGGGEAQGVADQKKTCSTQTRVLGTFTFCVSETFFFLHTFSDQTN
jgi:hypothetical protein